MSRCSLLVMIAVGPNRNTIGLCAVLAAMWYAGAGQSNGAAYLLCFALVALAMVSVAHAWANLRGITVSAGRIRSVFAGEELAVPLRLEAKPGRRHMAVWIEAERSGPARLAREIVAGSPGEAILRMAAPRRGHFEGIEVEVKSLFPLGFFTARRRMALRQSYFVYPQPMGNLPLPLMLDPAREAQIGARIEGDDFAGVRSWQPGESMRHVDWKAVARGQRLLVKQWRGGAGGLLMLEWEALPLLPSEHRLSQLARWVLLAERGGLTYGLRLPGLHIEPAQGDAHFHGCLRALAAFESTEGKAAAGSMPE